MTDDRQEGALPLPLEIPEPDSCPGLLPPPVVTTTGRSERTPYKLKLLNAVVGREAGAFTRISWLHRWVAIDLCSGDGVAGDNEDWTKCTSPGVFAFHAANAARSGRKVEYRGHEIARHTYSQLLESLLINMPTLGYEQDSPDGSRWRLRTSAGGSVLYVVTCVDSSTVRFDDVGKGDVVTLFNDPNTMSKWAAGSGVIQGMVRRGAYVTELHTMGCNPGGLLRIELEHRNGWYERVGEVRGTYSKSRQVCIIGRLVGDASKWGYLLVTPKAWIEKTHDAIRAAFRESPYPIELAQDGTPEFDTMQDLLFKTNRERSADLRMVANG